jgi:hypothetical protein
VSRRRRRGDPKRGRHRRATSPETARWLAEYAPPPQPSWMQADTWVKLNRLRRELES